jgi:SAM-dependent methyltransferase
MTTVAGFYDELSPFYHLVYNDWDASVPRQAAQINSVIHEIWGDRVRTILDAACGIGTQTIGLTEVGYAVTASDISGGAIERARREAQSRGLHIPFQIGDLRSLPIHRDGSFDLVIAWDNAIPHLLTDDDIRKAFSEMRRCVVPGGGCLISVRDYDASGSGTQLVPFGVRTAGQSRYVVFQVWQYHGAVYDLSMYFLEDTGGSECTAHVMRTQYYAVPVSRLMELMTESGFSEVRRIDGRLFQPLIVGVKK